MPISRLTMKFWCRHPALLYGISLLLGIYAGFYKSYYLLIPGLGLWIPFFACLYQSRLFSMLLLSLTAFFASWTYTSVYYISPSLPEEGLAGTAHVSIQSISLQTTPFGSRWLYDCQIQNFFPLSATGSVARRVKCSLALPQKQLSVRPLANQDYVIQGRLFQTENGSYRLKVSSSIPWAGAGGWSFAEQRFKWKRVVSKWIQNQFSDPLNGTFLAGLATGELDSPWIREEFARFGLQHILAISGFHFAIIAAFLNFILRLTFSRKTSAVILLTAMGSYCFFLGFSASVARAWIMSSVVVCAHLSERRSTALNSLGIALIAVIGIDPLLTKTLGFQFSFTVTAAILLAYQPFDHLFAQLLPKRRLSEVIEMDGWDQHGYYILAFLRQGLVLTAAVNVFALPLTLYFFHQFPWMSLPYNLFFPLLITGSLGLLLLGGLFSFAPYAGAGIHAINNAYTNLVLQLVHHMPEAVDQYLTVDSFPAIWMVCYLSCISLILIAAHSYLAEKQDNLTGRQWTFI